MGFTFAGYLGFLLGQYTIITDRFPIKKFKGTFS